MKADGQASSPSLFVFRLSFAWNHIDTLSFLKNAWVRAGVVRGLQYA
jgi:hypothetical protein